MDSTAATAATATTAAASPSVTVTAANELNIIDVPYGCAETEIDAADYLVDSDQNHDQMVLVNPDDQMAMESTEIFDVDDYLVDSDQMALVNPNDQMAMESTELGVADHPVESTVLVNPEQTTQSKSTVLVNPEQTTLSKSRLLQKSKLSYVFDASNQTLTRFWHDQVDQVMSPTPDELQLPNPGLLKGWDVDLRERLITLTKDKFYTHPQCQWQFRSLKSVEEHIKFKNFPDISVKFLNSVRLGKRPRTSETREYTPEEKEVRKLFVEKFFKDARENLDMRPDSVVEDEDDDEGIEIRDDEEEASTTK